MNIEHLIISNLINNVEYVRKVLPFLKEEYFTDSATKFLHRRIDHYVSTYNNAPTKDVLQIDLEEDRTLPEKVAGNVTDILEQIAAKTPNDLAWLFDQTEKYCQERSIEIALQESIEILENKKSKKTKDAIPEILSKALAVSFDTSIGHNYTEDAEARYDQYRIKENKIPFDLDIFNKITKGGIVKKTLNLIQAGTNVGKSLIMCHMAASNLMSGHNVLYITLEMSEKKIAERIDANLFDIDIELLESLPKTTFLAKANKLKSQKVGRLFIKEFPTSGAGASNFRHLINELRIKQNFIPDVVYIDYLSICSSSRLRASASSDLYVYGKNVAEELRGLAVETNVAMWSAMQTNRSGFKDSDAGIEHIAESWGVAATADFVAVVIQTEQLKQMCQYLFKQEKNRYGDKSKIPKFYVGVNTSRMKIFDIDQKNAEPAPDGKKSRTHKNFPFDDE